MRLYATTLGIDVGIFDAVANELSKLFKVDTHLQRIDSIHIKSNMTRLGRTGIFAKAIDCFLVNLKRQHLRLWRKIDAELL
jgi:hypothetical protein